MSEHCEAARMNGTGRYAGSALETQRFAIFNVLVSHCGESLTPDNVDKIMAEILREMREGPCAWAFVPNKELCVTHREQNAESEVSE